MTRDGAGPPSGWRPDEMTTAGRENLDPAHVERYDDKEDAGTAAEVARCLDLGLTPTATVVDLGAGTGQFTLAVAPHCARVVAVDVSPVMLDRLRAKVAAAGLTTVDVVPAGFLSYQHDGGPADLVYSRYALHHLPDFWKALALTRVRAILRPGGLFRLSDVVYHFDPSEAEERLGAWFEGAGTEAAVRGWHRAELEEHVRDEHSTYTWLLEPMLERAGFATEDVSYSDDGIFAKYILRAV
jgi:SAM-dependent methyltransferase